MRANIRTNPRRDAIIEALAITAAIALFGLLTGIVGAFVTSLGRE